MAGAQRCGSIDDPLRPEDQPLVFELRVEGKRVRVEASIGPRIDSFDDIDIGSNCIVGQPVSAAQGADILRALVRTDASALKAVGAAGAARMPKDPNVEFGLGELSNGLVVVVRGEGRAVDWAALPGIKPVGHTHPSVKGNDLPANQLGRAEVSVEELVKPTSDPLLVRELVFPSADDFIVMAQRRIDGHRMCTPFVVRDDVVAKPGCSKHPAREQDHE